MTDLRTSLHEIAEHLATVLDSGLARPVATASDRDAPAAPDAAEISAALAAFARGDLSERNHHGLNRSADALALVEALSRVRALVRAARGSTLRSASSDDFRASAERAAEAVGRQRVTLERAAAQLRELHQAAAEIERDAQEGARDAERASLLALNTGIEGLRIGGEVSRTLSALGDEIRKLAQASAASSREVAERMRAIGPQVLAIGDALEDARGAARIASEEAQRAALAAQDGRRQDADFASALDGFHLLDDSTERLVSELGASGARLEAQVARARALLGTSEGAARDAIDGALRGIELALGAGVDAPTEPRAPAGPKP